MHGVVDWEAAKKEALSELELRSVLHKQGFDRYEEVEKCVLEPNGNFYMEGIKSMSDDAQRAELMKEIRALSVEVRELKRDVIGEGVEQQTRRQQFVTAKQSP